MSELAFEYVQPGAVTEQDWALLAAADEYHPAYCKIPQLLIEHLLRQGHMHLFRFAHATGVLLVEVANGAPGHKRLRVIRASGRNVGWVFKEAAALLQHTAKEWGCQQIEAMVFNPRTAAALTKLGAKAEAVNMVLEVE